MAIMTAIINTDSQFVSGTDFLAMLAGGAKEFVFADEFAPEIIRDVNYHKFLAPKTQPKFEFWTN